MPVRYFQPAQSQQEYVPQYAPLPLNAIQYGAERAMQTRERADEALDAYTLQHQDILNKLTPQNRQAAQDILKQDTDFINRLSDPDEGVPYQDMVPMLRRQARKTLQEVKPFMEDSQQIQAFQERAREMYDKGDMSLSYRNYLDRLMGDYEGLQFDDQGRPQGFRPPPIVRKVDIHGRIEDYMRHLQDGHEQVLVDQYGEEPAFVREITQRYRSEEDIPIIRQMIASRITSADPEARDYLLAEHRAESDLRERTGQEPISENDFINQWVNPYVLADAMPRETQTLRRNPGFSLEDASTLPMAASLSIGNRHSEILTPRDLRDSIAETQELYNSVLERAQNDIQRLGAQADYDEASGQFIIRNGIGEDGIDYSSTINDYNRRLETSRMNIESLERYDQDIRKKAGLGEWDDVADQYEQEIRDAYANWNRPQGTLMIGLGDKARSEGKDPWKEFQKSKNYQRALENVSPEYRKYTELLHANARGGHRDVPVTTLGRAADQFMESYARRFGVHRGIYDGKTRELLSDKDRDFDMRTAEFAGVFPEEGTIWAAYNVYNEEGTDAQLILIDAPPEAEEYMLRAGRYNDFDVATYAKTRHLSDAPGGLAEASLPVTDVKTKEEVPDAAINIVKLRRGEQTADAQYHVFVPQVGGTMKRIEARDLNHVANIYRQYFMKINNITPDGQQQTPNARANR